MVFVDDIVAYREVGAGIDALAVRRQLLYRARLAPVAAQQLRVRKYREAQRRVLYARRYCAYRDGAAPRLRQLFELRVYDRGYVFLSEELLQYLRAPLIACEDDDPVLLF